MDETKKWMKPGVLIGIIGIVASFAATFSGVYLANSLLKKSEQEKTFQSYKSLLSLMHTDCIEILNLNKDVDPTDIAGELRKPMFLFDSALNNSLLLNNMDKSLLTEMIRSFSRVNFRWTGFGISPKTYPVSFPIVAMIRTSMSASAVLS